MPLPDLSDYTPSDLVALVKEVDEERARRQVKATLPAEIEKLAMVYARSTGDTEAPVEAAQRGAETGLAAHTKTKAAPAPTPTP